jgi:hypothetical protein
MSIITFVDGQQLRGKNNEKIAPKKNFEIYWKFIGQKTQMMVEYIRGI